MRGFRVGGRMLSKEGPDPKRSWMLSKISEILSAKPKFSRPSYVRIRQ